MTKKKIKRSKEAIERRRQSRFRTRDLKLNQKSGTKSDTPRFTRSDVVTLAKRGGTFKIGDKSAVFLKGIFAKEDCDKLCDVLLNEGEKLWEFKKDNVRGSKEYFTTGEWNALGHHMPSEPIYPAGKAGKAMEKNPEYYSTMDKLIKDFSMKITELIKKHRPDVFDEVGSKLCYGGVHLLIVPRGVSKMHKDVNDKLSILVLLKSEGDGGELELGGTKLAIAWNVGDVIILNSADIWHGSRKFSGFIGDRIVADFIIKKHFNGY